MQVKISNEHINKHKDDLRFTQPKYYFGQLLQNRKGELGIVLEMCGSTDSEWDYVLIDLKTNELFGLGQNELMAVGNEVDNLQLPPWISCRFPAGTATASPMTIKISNEQLEAYNSPIRFTQPRYHFGQLLRFPDEPKLVGVVAEMQFKQGGYTSKYGPLGPQKKIEKGWHYDLIEISDNFPPMMDIYTEQQLLSVDQRHGLLAQSS